MKRLSPAQFKWLSKLEQHGPSECHTSTGCACRRRGYTTWEFLTHEGELITMEEAEGRWPMPKWFDKGKITSREIITNKGREALKAHPHSE